MATLGQDGAEQEGRAGGRQRGGKTEKSREAKVGRQGLGGGRGAWETEERPGMGNFNISISNVDLLVDAHLQLKQGVRYGLVGR